MIFGDKGFTLVELMITVAISGIVLGAISLTYIMQQRSTTAQDQVVEMQQNIRAAMFFLERDIRMAGFDPTNTIPEPKIIAAANNSLQLSFDLNSDGDIADPGENVTYSLYVAGDGIQKLGRNDNTGGLGNQAVAENIDAIQFFYTLANGTQTTMPAGTDLPNIRSVQVSILARAARPDQNYTYSQRDSLTNAPIPFLPASGLVDVNWFSAGSPPGNPPGPGDHFRRRLLITTIQCRNMGL